MINDNSHNLRITRNMAVVAVSALILAGGTALANMSQPDTPNGPSENIPAAAEAREILDRASFVTFEAAHAVQKEQASSTNKDTAEKLKNYMAAITYVPKAVALPSDADALDEPWMASTAGVNDGMVVPHLDDEEGSAPLTGVQLDTALKAKTFLKLLKPVQNALITSQFGFRWGRPHQGIDMAAPVGTPILSAEHGKVVYSGWKQGYGNFVAVDHGHGYTTHYAHCSKVLVRTGQSVTKGQPIAKVGNTGHSTGPHLHFEVVANGIHRNPVKFLNHTLSVVQAK